MNPKRKVLVDMAFRVLDKDGNGAIEAKDVAGIYSANKHPDVLSGRKTKEAVLREFLDGFDVGGEVDGKVTRNEFENYYSNISASIDNDDYFELMIRNAWHISGGVGAAANSANRRVLSTRADGSQRVDEIQNDLGLAADDKAGMIARLKAQGVDVSSIELYGGMDDKKAATSKLPKGLVRGSTAGSARPSPVSVAAQVQLKILIDQQKEEARRTQALANGKPSSSTMSPRKQSFSKNGINAGSRNQSHDGKAF